MAMSVNISGVTNKDDSGHYSWEKKITDVNDVDESFATARDLGYTRLNYARVTTVSSLDKYDKVDNYAIQLQSNGKLKVSLRSGEGNDEKVLNLSKYEEKLEEFKKQLDPLGYAQQEIDKLKEKEESSTLDTTAPGMYLKVYMNQNGKQVLIADSSADKDSKLYQAAEEILNGEYKAKKGNYYFQVGYAEDTEIPKKGTAYALQILQGTTYKHDYVTTETKSSDSKNKETTTQADSSLTAAGGAYGVSTISAGYAAQIQAMSYSYAADMLATGYMNMASILSSNDSNKAASLFSCLL